MVDMIGQQFGQYEVTALLGEGGMATVYRAHQQMIQRDVAIKFIKPNLENVADFVKRFEREAQLLASLSHPHILKIFDYGLHDDLAYLVMELHTGGSLANLLHQSPISPTTASRILDQIASALDYAHERSIIHRDFKPQNVLLDEKGNAILTDFGLARMLNETLVLTRPGTAMGTPAYMPPEQWRGEPLDARSDIYALGVTLFEMLSGKMPFNADTPFSMMYMHIYERPPSICALKPSLPLAVEQVIDTCLAKDREQRFNSAVEVVVAFNNALSAAEKMSPGLSEETLVGNLESSQIPDSQVNSKVQTTAAAAQVGRPRVVIVGLIAVLSIVLLISGVMLGLPGRNIAVPSQTALPMVIGPPTNTLVPAPTTGPTVTLPRTSSQTAASQSTLVPGPDSLGTALGAGLLLHDGFDGTRLSDRWDVWNKQPQVVDGRLIIEGDGNWGNGIVQNGIRENEGVALLFKFDTGSMEFQLASDLANEANAKAWHFGRYVNGVWEVVSSLGDKAYVSHQTALLNPNHWYYLLMRVGNDGHLYTQVWDPDHPEQFILNTNVAPRSDGWLHNTWDFIIQVNSGSLTADWFERLNFHPDYQPPAQPPHN